MSPLKLRVEVTLASVKRLVEADDPRGSVLEKTTWPRLERRIDRVILAGTEARTAEESSERESTSFPITGIAGDGGESESQTSQANLRSMETAARRDVFKYVQVKDRYMALVSILLKSKSYHQSVTDDRFERAAVTANDGRRALVLLPRTPHGKPYLPTTPSIRGAGRFDSKPLQINVSHQYPVVGIARLSPCSGMWGQPTSRGINRFADLHVGFDVVMFDPYPPRLYGSAVEFLEMFRDKLTGEEWDDLMLLADYGSDTDLLHEFYLFWAVKEAYTKAIGVGLGYDFSSLRVELEEPGCLDGSRLSTLYGEYFSSVIFKNAPELIPVTVHLLDENRIELWRVALHPIFQQRSSGDIREHVIARSHNSAAGCFCVFVGPFDIHGESGGPELERNVEVDWRDLHDLIHFHTL